MRKIGFVRRRRASKKLITPESTGVQNNCLSNGAQIEVTLEIATR
jgi:hypothetical protein